MFWTKEHDVILLRELVNLNLHRKKKGIYTKKYVGKSGRGIK